MVPASVDDHLARPVIVASALAPRQPSAEQASLPLLASVPAPIGIPTCRRGLHWLTPDNLLRKGGGKRRVCRACWNDRQREQRARRKARVVA